MKLIFAFTFLFISCLSFADDLEDGDKNESEPLVLEGLVFEYVKEPVETFKTNQYLL